MPHDQSFDRPAHDPGATVSVAALLDPAWQRRQGEAWTYRLEGDDFDAAVEALSVQLDEADGPHDAAEHDLWCRELEVVAERLAVWDFDYYLLVVWETDKAKRWCQKRTPGWGVAPGRR